MVQVCKDVGVKYLIFTSHVLVVADKAMSKKSASVTLQEDMPYPVQHLSHFFYAKRLAEEIVLRANSSNLKTMVLRLCNDIIVSLILGLRN